MELSVVNPTTVMGPVLSSDYAHSIQIIKQMLNGEMKGCPKLITGFVDVRDVADLHLKALSMPEANGQRFIAVAGEALSMLEVAAVLRKNLGKAADKAPTKELPSWMIRVLAVFNPKLKMIVPHLGLVKRASNEKAKRLLGWKPRNAEEAILAAAESLIKFNQI